MSLLRALHAEALKAKRTLFLAAILLAPLLVILLQMAISWRQMHHGPPVRIWDAMAVTALSVWAVFLLPLLVTLEAALLAAMEHGERQWKHLFALPVSRAAVYAAKFIAVAAAALLSTLVLAALVLALGLALQAVAPELLVRTEPPVRWIVKKALLMWVASLLLVAVQTWVSLRWASFPLAIGVGIAGTFFAMFASSASVGAYDPWMFPLNALGGMPGDRVAIALGAGGLGGVLVASLACGLLPRRDVV